METSVRCNMACEVLQKTNDGEALAPGHLWLLQEWVNDQLNEKGEEELVDKNRFPFEVPCSICGSDNWWREDGEWLCGQCHPEP